MIMKDWITNEMVSSFHIIYDFKSVNSSSGQVYRANRISIGS